MTSTLHDTGDIRLGETRDHTYLTRPPVLRRPPATGELPIYRPVGVDELARLSAGETLVLPVDAVPSVPRHAAPVVYQPAQPEVIKPLLRRGRRRAPTPPWAWALIGAGLCLLFEVGVAAAFVAVLVVNGVLR